MAIHLTACLIFALNDNEGHNYHIVYSFVIGQSGHQTASSSLVLKTNNRMNK